MDQSQIFLITGELNVFDWDGIVFPHTVNQPLDKDSVAQFSALFTRPVPPLVMEKLGQLHDLEFRIPDAAAGALVTKHLVFYSVTDDRVIDGTSIVRMIRELARFLAANPDIESFCIPLLSQDASPQAAFEMYKLMSENLVRFIQSEIDIKIYLPDRERYRRLAQLIADEPIAKMVASRDARRIKDQRFYLVKSHMADASTGFIQQGLWFPGNVETFHKILPELKLGDFLCLRQRLSDRDMIKIVAIGQVTGMEEVGLHVDWFIPEVNLVSRSEHQDIAIVEITHERLIRELVKIIEGSKWNPVAGSMGERRGTIEEENISLSRINNDSDSGNDYLDISSDVDAFAKIIALKSFTPPLAIALCGRWGAGKSFFINKLIERIDSLSRLKDKDTFCKGVVHIHFNAWSYMDSNLWASMVGRIFSGLNDYINEDQAAGPIKRRIKEQIQQSLFSTKENLSRMEQEKTQIDEDIKKLKQEKSNVEKDWKKEIAGVRKKSLGDFIAEADHQFDVSGKIEQAISENQSAQSLANYIRKHYPKEVWGKSDFVEKELSSIYVFLMEFFRKDRWKWYLGYALILVFVYVGMTYIIPEISAFIKHYVFEFSPSQYLAASALGAVMTRGIGAYKRLKPLLSSLWSIGQQYKNRIDDAHFRYEQLQKSFVQKLALKQERLRSLDEQLVSNKQLKVKLEYQLDHRVNTMALSDFISEKSGMEGYRKQQGIIANIREDFVILSDLFTGSRAENVAANEMLGLQKPVERIILYIDDLDRCAQDRIVEVLEAVNLLMAFKLFVVVAGIDPKWVKDALVSKKIANSSQAEDSANQHMASFYLEKIFQVPFHLKSAENDFIQNMIRELCNADQLPIQRQKVSLDPVLYPKAYQKKLQESFPDLVDELEAANEPAAEEPALSVSANWQTLVFDQEETDRLTEFSVLLNANPRSIKRFVNIYQIISAHQGLEHLQGFDYGEQKLSVMLLLAIHVGKFRDLNSGFQHYLSSNRDKKLSHYLDSDYPGDRMMQGKANLKKLLHTEALSATLKLPTSLLLHHARFVCRFSFDNWSAEE
ncbi:MAG: hypothetical protein EOO45_02185 [Flavobacterium sp.]|nr:MAG: hypothetical protein EOO45_02185 [Flavobacterium sp.]